MTTIKVQADKPGAKINPAMWGIFFEDINFGADGGLYAELVKNRAFEFPDPLMGWTKISPSKARGQISVRRTILYNSQSALRAHPIRRHAHFGVSNEGFRGMGVRKAKPITSPPKFAECPVRRFCLCNSIAPTALAGLGAAGGVFRHLEKMHGDIAPHRYRRKTRLLCLWKARVRLTSIWCRSSRKTPGRSGPAVCARTWCRRWPT